MKLAKHTSLTVHGLRVVVCMLLGVFVMATSCTAYRQKLLFKTKKNMSLDSLRIRANKTLQDYHISPGSTLVLEVLANKGELIIDPNFELLRDISTNLYVDLRKQIYIVRADGLVRLPMLGLVSAAGKTFYQLEQELQRRYNVYYNNAYVRVIGTNLRVVVLRGESGYVIPLDQGHMHILEVLALAGGLHGVQRNASLLLLRGDMYDPEVYKIDLSQLSSMQASMLTVQPGDVLYIPPARVSFLGAATQFAPFVSVLSAILTVIIVLRNL